jgi:putative flippase GtrA
VSSQANPVSGRLVGRYAVVGVWNTVFGLATFTVLWWAFGDRVGYLVTLLVAQVVAVVQAHATQRVFVWRSRARYLPELGRFSLVYFGGLAVNMVALAVAVEWLGLPVLASQWVITAIVIVGQFTAQRLWAFRSHRRQAG